MKVQAKFKCVKIDHYPTTRPQDSYAQVRLMPVYNDSPENEGWSKATPSGSIEMTITNPNAIEAFEVGRNYLIDFTPVD